MTDAGKQQLIETVDRLRHELQALPSSDDIAQAIYQCERLRLAIGSSHSEGTRFAGYTVARLLRNRQGELTPAAAAHLQQLRDGLRDAGFEI